MLEMGQIAGEVRAHIARQQLTIAEVATRAGMKRSTLAAKLKGDYGFTVAELVAVARVLDVEAADLIALATIEAAS